MDYNDELRDLAADTLGVRLEVARFYRYPGLSIAKMAQHLHQTYNISKSTYYGHERGTRKPPMAMLYIYSMFFKIPIEYFLHGVENSDYEAVARQQAAQQKKTLRIDFLDGASSAGTAAPVNQRFQNEKLPLCKNNEMRLIIRIMAKDVEKIVTGEKDIDDLDGERLSAPSFLSLSRDAFWWQIPDYDFSMADPSKAALPPGTLCLIDCQAKIEPGRFVFALLKNASEPIVRQYVSDRIWNPGTRFTLHALNSHSEDISVTAPSECLLLARIVFSGSAR